jgi:hypothetical protein
MKVFQIDDLGNETEISNHYMIYKDHDDHITKRYFKDGVLYKREEHIGDDVKIEWTVCGVLHREDGPAVENRNFKKWYHMGKLHRIGGPAAEFANGTREWYQNGKHHREDGPAVINTDGVSIWYYHGKKHRVDGPAVEYSNGSKEWWIEGKIILSE